MSKKTTGLFNTILLTTLALSASCSNSGHSVSAPISTKFAAKLALQGKTTDASEMYARIGEILLTKPEGIIHAQEMFQKSLEINKNNNKANIYSAVLAPVLTLKGFVPRFKNVSDINYKKKASIQSFEEEVKRTEVPEFIDFALEMPEGAAPAKNAEDIRKFVRSEYAQELSNSMAKLDNIKSDVFTLNLNIASSRSRRSLERTCEVKEDGSVECQEQQSAMQNGNITIDAYDIKALRNILKTERNALMITTSFGLEGFKYVTDRLKNTKYKTDKMVVEAIKSQPNLLKLQGTKEDLREIFDHTEEIMNDVIDFSKISSTVCKSEDRKSDLFNNICVTEKTADKLTEALMFIVGPKSVLLGHDANGREVAVEINLRGMMDSKITNLQELLPSKFDLKGKATDIKDLTFAGIIPNGDLIEKLKTVVSK